MARIRSVHPDICRSETLAGVSASAERTFVRLWTACDDHGRAVAHPKLLKADLYPFHDDMTVDRVADDIAELEAHGVLTTYTADGKRYLQVRSWGEYQHPAKPTPSKLPPPPDMEATESPGKDTTPPPDSVDSTEPSLEPTEESLGSNGLSLLEVGDGDGDGDGEKTSGEGPDTEPTPLTAPQPPKSPPKGGLSLPKTPV